jgi:ABC-type multidrug transport system fused ATPase/permease subunit
LNTKKAEIQNTGKKDILIDHMKLPSIFNKSRTRIFIRLALNGLAQAAIHIATILMVRWAFDHLIRGSASAQPSGAIRIGLGLSLAAICIGWLRMVERVDAERIGQGYIHQIRMLLFKHMSCLAPRALQGRSRGAIVLRFIGDLNALKRWVSLGIARITVASITAFCTLTALAFISLRLAFTVSAVLVLGALYSVRLGKDIREAVKESRRRRSHLAANVNEKVASMAVVQVFGQSSRERKRIRRQSRRLTKALIARAKKIGLMRGITHSVTALASGAVLLQGAYVVRMGEATPGTVVAAMTIVGLLVPALRDLSRVYEYFQESRVSARKIIDFLETPSLVQSQVGAPDFKPGPGVLEFRNVSFGNVLKKISVTAEARKRIVIIGPNGTGKTTLLSMAVRLIDPEEGEILLDGQNIATHSLKSVRRAISMVSPDLPLLRGTVKKNLLYRWPKAPADEIERVWKLCGIHELLNDLPRAERTKVTEEGNSLSLGQRQRIGLARAFLGNPKIILLDEADVHLDKEAGKLLARILNQYTGTVIWVTHNPDRISRADCIWRLEGGSLVELSEQRLCQNVN